MLEVNKVGRGSYHGLFDFALFGGLESWEAKTLGRRCGAVDFVFKSSSRGADKKHVSKHFGKLLWVADDSEVMEEGSRD